MSPRARERNGRRHEGEAGRQAGNKGGRENLLICFLPFFKEKVLLVAKEHHHSADRPVSHAIT